MAEIRNNESAGKGAKAFVGVMMGIGGVIGLWAGIAIFAGLAQSNWQIGELVRQYMVAAGLMKEFETWVDFYTYIKGVEYIIIVAFLGLFPLLFKYLNLSSAQVDLSKEQSPVAG
ncbi:MAG: hypothetical protein ACLFV2_04230 [Desulfurivibrionaceae bacterium]